MSEVDTTYQCKICVAFPYASWRGLTYHHSKKHPNLPKLSLRKKEIQCELCGREIIKTLLSYHSKLCPWAVQSEDKVIKLDIQIKRFISFPDFLEWKEQIELQTRTKFVKGTGRLHDPISSFANKRRYYYNCNRSGFFRTKGKGMIKKKCNLVKINKTCPASLKVALNEDGTCSVKYTSTHVGHELDEKYLGDYSKKREKMLNNRKEDMKRMFNSLMEDNRNITVDNIDKVYESFMNFYLLAKSTEENDISPTPISEILDTSTTVSESEQTSQNSQFDDPIIDDIDNLDFIYI